MNLTDIGNLRYDDQAFSRLKSGVGGAAAADGMREAAGDAGASPFARLLDAANSAGKPSGAAAGKPVGAAANSGAKDAEHASGKPASIDRNSKLYEQCRELETFLIKNLLSGLRKTVEKSEMSDGGFAGQMYDDMLWDEYAVSMSKNAGLGLADQVYMELSGQRGRSA